MSCALDAELCILEHWCPVLGGHREPATWRAPCPLCGPTSTHVPLSFWVQGRGVRWTSYCPCDRSDIRVKLAALLPGCVSARYQPKHSADPAALITLILDKSLPPNALRVALLQELGMSTPDIRKKLGLPKQSWSDVVRILGQNRRSGRSENSDHR